MIGYYAGDICVKGIPHITAEVVVVALHTTHITCLWVQRVHHHYYALRAYRVYACNNLQIGRGVLFNTTWVGHTIQTFLRAYSLRNAFIALMPDSATIPHGALTCVTADPTMHDFASSKTRDTMHMHHYAYPQDDNRFIFYWYRMPYTLLLQYICTMIHHQCNLLRITPRFYALFAAYQMMHGITFRPSQLAVDMEKVDNKLSRYFTKDSIQRCVQGVDANAQQNPELMLDIIAAAGIVWCQKDI